MSTTPFSASAAKYEDTVSPKQKVQTGQTIQSAKFTILVMRDICLFGKVVN